MNFNRDKKVVVVYGDAETGKTTALCMLCESLISRCLVGWFVLQKKRDKNRLTTVPKNRRGAYQDVLCAVRRKKQSGKNVMVGMAIQKVAEKNRS